MHRAANVILIGTLLSCSGNSTGPNAHGVADVSMMPDTLTIAVGDSATVQAQAVSAAGVPVAGVSLFWSTSDSSIATVDQTGMVKALAVGGANVDASTAGVSPAHPTRVVVVATPVASIVIAPTTATVRAGGSFQFTDTTKDAAGHVLTGRAVSWSSSDTTVAPVDQAGLVLGKKQGSATVTVSSGSARATATVTVTSVPTTGGVASIVVTPKRFTITTHGTQQVTAQALDAAGHNVNGLTFVWTTKSGGTVSQVNASGTVTGVATGSDSVFASAAGVSGGAAVTVVPAPVAKVIVSPSSATITNSNDSNVQLTATLEDAQGDTLVGPAVTWSSSDPNSAVVSSTGVVTATDGGSHGTVTITAKSEGKSGSATVTVIDGGG